MRSRRWSRIAAIAACVTWSTWVEAHAPSGAIFTTLADGSEVNVNQYPSKESVYLDGGPGIGAPPTAAGLDDGIYVFQVTDPSGKELLSLDAARCRQFIVSGGVITAVVANACQHATGFDVDHGAVTVQLMPYADTPNPGGVYKVWVTPLEDFLAGCAELGQASGLDVVDCGRSAGNAHGFIPAHSKTDNFKVREVPIREIDTIFLNANTGEVLSGRKITWIDPLGASNIKWSYLVKFWNAVEAHVEGVEDGNHQIVVENQEGCAVTEVVHQGTIIGTGPATVVIPVRGHQKHFTTFVYVYCQ